MPTLTLRPDSTIGFNDMTIVGGSATAHDAVADETNATYIRKPSGTSFARFGTGNQTLPAGARVKRIRWIMLGRPQYPAVEPYASGDPGDNASDVDIWLQSADSSFSTYKWSASWGLSVSGATGATFVQRTGPYSVVSPGFGQYGIDTLEIRFRVQSTDPALEVSWMAASVEYMTQPVVAVTAPTGTIGTTDPTITWTYTQGTDGGPQMYYQWRLYASSVYSQPGFNVDDPAYPYLAVPTDDKTPSGTISQIRGKVYRGDATSVTAKGYDLPNGNYRAYVRAAQGYGGHPHWSNWAYSQFTVNTTPATITAVGNAINTTGTVSIDVDSLNAEVWQYVEFERLIDVGVWERMTDIATMSKKWIVDYFPQVGPLTYRARAVKTTGPIYGPWVQVDVTLAPSNLWLKSPTDYNLNVNVVPVSKLAETEPRPQGVFDPIGSRYAVTVSGAVQSRRGELIVYTETDAEAEALRDLLEEPVLFVQHAIEFHLPAFWASFGDIDRSFDSVVPGFPHRIWRLPFVEVAVP